MIIAYKSAYYEDQLSYIGILYHILAYCIIYWHTVSYIGILYHILAYCIRLIVYNHTIRINIMRSDCEFNFWIKLNIFIQIQVEVQFFKFKASFIFTINYCHLSLPSSTLLCSYQSLHMTLIHKESGVKMEVRIIEIHSHSLSQMLKFYEAFAWWSSPRISLSLSLCVCVCVCVYLHLYLNLSLSLSLSGSDQISAHALGSRIRCCCTYEI